MSWNYRVIKKESGDYEIHEVYYKNKCNKKNKCKCKIEAISTNPMSAYGETPQELSDDLQAMAEAFERPVLKMKKLEKMFNKKEKKWTKKNKI